MKVDLFNQIIVGPTAETQQNRSYAPVKSNVKHMLYDKINELIPKFSTKTYSYIGSYTGIRPATEYSDYQIEPFNDIQWICCGGIRSTGLTSSLAIGEYVREKLEEMIHIKHELVCEGYSSERYYRSLEQLKSMFNMTANGLQPTLVVNESQVSPALTGDVHFSENAQLFSLRIDCDGEIFHISHSLLKLAWMTSYSK